MKICEICKKTISEDEVFGVDGHESVCFECAEAVELIEIPIRDWADVDRLEGYPRLYDRVLADFRLPDGSTVQAWIYTMNHLPEQAEVIPSGDWKVR